MKICIPVQNSLALESDVCEHFGSAPYFMIVDSQTHEIVVVENGNQHHAHGMCQPLAALSGHVVEAIVVGGIGMGALNKLNASGIKVYRTACRTVRETIAALEGGSLELVGAQGACHGHGCH